MLADIEQHGMWLDSDRVQSEYTRVSGIYGQVTEELERTYGGVNWNSPKQIRELLYGRLGFSEVTDYKGVPVRTDTDQASTSGETIAKLRARSGGQSEFLRLYGTIAEIRKEHQFLEAMKGCCDEDGGHLYAAFNQTIAGNHRLTSTGGKWGLQFQNQPKHLRSLFRARSSGRRLVNGDCPQLEFRVATDLAHDNVAKRDILGRIDVHNQTATVMRSGRDPAKRHTFKPLYGGNSGTPRERAYYAFFREKYSGIYNCQMRWVYDVLDHKQLTTATGLIFYWPDTQRLSSGYITNTPAIFNYPISSFATADISQLSLWLVWQELRGLDTVVCNTVHDSGLLDAPLEEVDKVEQTMVYCYGEKIYEVLRSLYGYDFTTPLGIGLKTGTHWEEGDERKFESPLFTFTA
jgi:DNA polymerase family A